MLFGQKLLRLQNIPLCQLGNDFFILLLALAIGFQKAGKAQSGAGCTEGIVLCRKLYGKRIISAGLIWLATKRSQISL